MLNGFTKGWDARYRLTVAVWAAALLLVAQAVGYLLPSVDQALWRFRSGRTGTPALLIALIGAVVPSAVIAYAWIGNNSASIAGVLELVAFYVVLTLAGWLSLWSSQEYAREDKEDQ